MKKRGLIPILVLLALIFLSACSKEEESAAEDSWFMELNKLVVETVLEKSEVKDMINASDIVIDQIYYGSFSDESLRHQENANEIFVVCKILHTIHAVSCDRRAGVLLDKNTLQVVAFKDFQGDETEIRCLQISNGQQRVMHLYSMIYQGCRGTSIVIYAIQDREWVEISTEDITELFPVSEKYEYGAFSYYIMGERLVVTWESFPKIKADQILDPAELIAILVWDPNKEQFVIAPNTEQPTVRQD